MPICLQTLLFVNHLSTISVENTVFAGLKSEPIAKPLAKSPNVLGSNSCANLNVVFAEC